MSFVASKWLALLIYPLSFSLIVIVVGLLLVWRGARRTGLGLTWFAVGWLYLCSTGFFSAFLIGQLEGQYPAKALSAVPRSDAIVLLGGATRGYAHMATLADLNEHADRLVHAVALYRAGKAPVILASGGTVHGEHPESEQLRDLLQVMGVPGRDLVLESDSRNTYENAVNVASAAKGRGWNQVLLVTSAYHMPRAMALFTAQGVNAVAAPTDFKRIVSEGPLPGWLPGANNLQRSSTALHEMVGYQVYRWRGWL